MGSSVSTEHPSGLTNREDDPYGNGTRLDAVQPTTTWPNEPTTGWPTAATTGWPTQTGPAWPTPRDVNEIMFVVPKRLNIGDSFLVKGYLTSNQTGTLSVNLLGGYQVVDYETVACQLEVNFDSRSIRVNVVHNGVAESLSGDHEGIDPSDHFVDKEYALRYQVTADSSIDLYINGSYLSTVELRHSLDDIRYLTFTGNAEKVTELSFKFA